MEQNNINQQPQQHSGLGIAGMIIGIISILFACLAIGGFLGAIGLILSIIGVFQKNRKKGMAIAGIVLNIIAILIMLIMLAAVASSDDDSVKNVTPESQIASTEQNTIEEQPVEASTQENIKESSVQSDVFGVGETAEYRNVQVTLVGVNESSGSQYNTPSDGNIFVLPEFEIVNNSDSDLSISSLMTFTAYQDGYSTNLSITALMENTGTQLDGSIAPGKKMKGCIGYEIPAECKELEIHVQTDLLSSEDIVFIYKR